jgi:hypothetical protein
MANKKKTMKKTMKNVMKNGMNSMKNVMKSGMKSVMKKPKKGTKKGKRALTPWNLLVQKVYEREKKNGKSFKECLIIAAQEKKKGKMH